MQQIAELNQIVELNAVELEQVEGAIAPLLAIGFWAITDCVIWGYVAREAYM